MTERPKVFVTRGLEGGSGIGERGQQGGRRGYQEGEKQIPITQKECINSIQVNFGLDEVIDEGIESAAKKRRLDVLGGQSELLRDIDETLLIRLVLSHVDLEKIKSMRCPCGAR